MAKIIRSTIKFLCLGFSIVASAPIAAQTTDATNAVNKEVLAKRIEVGDVVFIRIPHAPFTKVADTTSSWTNHVGIVSDVSGGEPLIAESHVPVSGVTPLSKFLQRSEQGRVAVLDRKSVV